MKQSIGNSATRPLPKETLTKNSQDDIHTLQ